MLVLSRKSGESLRIGNDIELTVVEIRGDSVRLAIKAPREIPVWRGELVAEIREANIKAGQAGLEGAEQLARILGGGSQSRSSSITRSGCSRWMASRVPSRLTCSTSPRQSRRTVARWSAAGRSGRTLWCCR